MKNPSHIVSVTPGGARQFVNKYDRLVDGWKGFFSQSKGKVDASIKTTCIVPALMCLSAMWQCYRMSNISICFTKMLTNHKLHKFIMHVLRAVHHFIEQH